MAPLLAFDGVMVEGLPPMDSVHHWMAARHVGDMELKSYSQISDSDDGLNPAGVSSQHDLICKNSQQLLSEVEEEISKPKVRNYEEEEEEQEMHYDYCLSDISHFALITDINFSLLDGDKNGKLLSSPYSDDGDNHFLRQFTDVDRGLERTSDAKMMDNMFAIDNLSTAANISVEMVTDGELLADICLDNRNESHNRCSPNSVLSLKDDPARPQELDARYGSCGTKVEYEGAKAQGKNHTFRQRISHALSQLLSHNREETEDVSRGEILGERWTCSESGDLPTHRTNRFDQLCQRVDQQDKRMQLLERLFTCAEAVACRDLKQASYLVDEIKAMASPYGDSLQRVASCFVDGLSARLELQLMVPSHTRSASAEYNNPLCSVTQTLTSAWAWRQKAFLLMYELCPYVAFGHFVANSAILETMEEEDLVHVVDLGTEYELQWVPFIHELAVRAGGPPRLLSITMVGSNKARMELIGSRLRWEAKSASLPGFEIKSVAMSIESLATERSLRLVLGIRPGEAIAVNSVLQLHCVVKESRGSLNGVLQAIHHLSPKVLTLVEQDVNHNGPFFVGRFMEALHFYSSIFDSLQAVMPRYDTRRIKIEQFHFANEIRNIVACEGPARVERHERVEQWRRRMSRAGFIPSPLRMAAATQLWLGRFYASDDYTLCDDKGSLVLGWKSKPIVAASAWRC